MTLITWPCMLRKWKLHRKMLHYPTDTWAEPDNLVGGGFYFPEVRGLGAAWRSAVPESSYIFVILGVQFNDKISEQMWIYTLLSSSTLLKWGKNVIRIFSQSNLFVYHWPVIRVHLFVFLGFASPLHTTVIISCYSPCLNTRFWFLK